MSSVQTQIQDAELEFIQIVRDPGGYLATLNSKQKVAYHLWLHTGDLRLAAFVFPKQFPEERITFFGIHTPVNMNQFAFRVG